MFVVFSENLNNFNDNIGWISNTTNAVEAPNCFILEIGILDLTNPHHFH